MRLTVSGTKGWITSLQAVRGGGPVSDGVQNGDTDRTEMAGGGWAATDEQHEGGLVERGGLDPLIASDLAAGGLWVGDDFSRFRKPLMKLKADLSPSQRGDLREVLVGDRKRRNCDQRFEEEGYGERTKPVLCVPIKVSSLTREVHLLFFFFR